MSLVRGMPTLVLVAAVDPNIPPPKHPAMGTAQIRGGRRGIEGVFRQTVPSVPIRFTVAGAPAWWIYYFGFVGRSRDRDAAAAEAGSGRPDIAAPRLRRSLRRSISVSDAPTVMPELHRTSGDPLT